MVSFLTFFVKQVYGFDINVFDSVWVVMHITYNFLNNENVFVVLVVIIIYCANVGV